MATAEVKGKVSEKVKEMMAAQSCCEELKAAGAAWLDAEGTEGEADATAALLKELEEDVCPIDGAIAFFSSPNAAGMFGENMAAELLQKASDAKAQGVRYCICEACTAGGAILDLKEELL